MATDVKSKASATNKATVFWYLLAGDRKWGWLRLSALVFLTVLLVVGSFFVHGSLRYLIVPFAAVLAAFMAGVRYLQDIYELENFWHVFRYFFASFFGVFYPKLSVYSGKKVTRDGKENMLDIIGGPGFVNVQPGNAVLYEGQRAPAAIHTSGHHFVPRYERIQPIAMEEQYGEIEESSAMSRDGFEVKIRHTRFSFRLAADRATRSRENPYPYSSEAIYNMIYNRTVSEQGLGEWHSGVESEIRKVLADYINSNTLDHLTAPTEAGADPRGKIKQGLRSPEVTKKLRDRGAELLWVDIGSFEIPNKLVEQQRLNTWQAKWMGDARVARSFGEAQHLAYQEIGRAEAQAEMLISIMHSLADVNLQGGTRQTLRDVILVRTAQLLDAMGEGAEEKGVNAPAPSAKGKKGP